jgi:hypothetical protein
MLETKHPEPGPGELPSSKPLGASISKTRTNRVFSQMAGSRRWLSLCIS